MKSFRSIRRRLQAIYPRGRRGTLPVEVNENSVQSAKPGSTPSNQEERAHLDFAGSDNRCANEQDDALPVPTSTDNNAGERDITATFPTGQESVASTVEEETGTDPRSHVWVQFQGEDEDDYTDGPLRLIDTTDGLKTCTALLMTLELSAKIQKALRVQRYFVKTEAIATEKLDALLRFDSKLSRQVLDHEIRVCKLQTDDGPNGNERGELEEEIRILKLMREANESERAVVSNNLNFQATELRKAQSAVIADLEEPFVFARLMDAEEDVFRESCQELDLQHEFEAFRANLDEYAGQLDEETAPLQTYTNNLELFGPLTEGEMREKEIKEAWLAASVRLQAAEWAFDNREAEREAELNASNQAEERGEDPIYASQEDYDMRMLVREQELTRELIQAEEELAAAKAALKDEGLEFVAEYETSEFADDVADGYRDSFEQECIDSAPKPEVHNWLDSMSSPRSPNFNDRLDIGDEWQAKEVDMSDSISQVGQGSDRRRIDKWRKICGL